VACFNNAQIKAVMTSGHQHPLVYSAKLTGQRVLSHWIARLPLFAAISLMAVSVFASSLLRLPGCSSFCAGCLEIRWT
jgi:hypothetical protein